MKEQHSSHLSENRCLPASTLKPEEREFVVDSRASMHMISKKELNSAEMDTLTKSCSPTIVITANGEVQTQEEAIVYFKELDIFLTMKVFENTPAVLSLGKLCDENGYSYEWINFQNHISFKTGFGYNATRRTSFLSWFQACQIRLQDLIHQFQGHLQDRRVIGQRILPARRLHLQYVKLRLENERIELRVTSLQWLCQLQLMRDQGDLLTKPTQNPKPNKNEDHDQDRGDP